MFCKKCGNEVSPSEKFCSKCGTPVANEAPSQPQPQPQPQPQMQTKSQAKAKELPINIPSQIKHPLGIMCLVAALLHLLQPIFWVINTIKIVEIGEETLETPMKLSLATIFGSFFPKSMESVGFDLMTKTFATVLTIIFAIVAILLSVAPILTNTVTKGRKPILQIFSCVWSLVWLIYGVNCIPGYFEDLIGLSFTFFGWIFILISLLTLLVNVAILLVSNKIISLKK